MKTRMQRQHYKELKKRLKQRKKEEKLQKKQAKYLNGENTLPRNWGLDL